MAIVECFFIIMLNVTSKFGIKNLRYIVFFNYTYLTFLFCFLFTFSLTTFKGLYLKTMLYFVGCFESTYLTETWPRV